MINKCLASHPEIYFFNDAEQCFAGLAGAGKRVSELKNRKKSIIENEILHKIKENLQSLREENQLSVGGYSINRSTISAFIGHVLKPTLALGIASWLWDPDAPSISDSVRDVALYNHEREVRDRAISIGLGAMHAGVDATLLPASFASKERELLCAIKDIEFALNNDPLWPDEERVMRAWHTLVPGMKKTLVDALTHRRFKTGKDARILIEQIDSCLKIPRSYKQLVPGLISVEDIRIEEEAFLQQELTKDFRSKRDAFIDDEFTKAPWCNYSQKTQEQLKSAFKRVCNEAQKARAGKCAQRTILYFHGAPGTGKSFAAQAAAKMFKLPHMLLPIGKKEDLSQRNMTGNDSPPSDRRLGCLFLSLFKSDDENNNWQNPVACIEEFDRLFGKKDNVPSFALQVLDPDVKQLKCEYFGEDVYLPISGIILILTGNTDLGKSGVQEMEFIKQLEALRDRFIFVHFDGFVSDVKKDLIKGYLNDGSFLEYSTEYADQNHDEITEAIAVYICKNFSEASTRDVKRLAERLAETPMEKWDSFKQDQ